MTSEHAHPTTDTHSVASTGAYFRQISQPEIVDGVRTTRFTSTDFAQGTWQDDELHMAPVSGLLMAEVEEHDKKPHFHTGRISFDILGKLEAGELTVTTRTIRPGRTIELVEATLVTNNRASLQARVWRLATTDTQSVSVIKDQQLTPLEDCEDAAALGQWPGGYIASVVSKVAPNHAPGHGRAWLNTPIRLIEDREVTELARLMGLVDTANGVAPVIDAHQQGFAYPNVDLTIHFYRQPVGQWLGFYTTANAGTHGLGLTTAVLHDQHGPFGHSEQLQTIRPFSGHSARNP